MSRREQTGGSGTAPARPPSPSSRAGGSATTARSVARLPATGPGGSPAVHERLLRATVDVVSTLGYADTRAAHIVQASGLSRTVFYRHFGGKGPAVLAAARGILDELLVAVRTVLVEHGEGDDTARTRPVGSSVGPGDPAGQGDLVEATVGLTAFAEALAADPPAATVLFLEAPAAGAKARALRADLVALLARTLGASDDGLPRSRPHPQTVEMRAGALHDLLHRRIAHGDTAGLPALVPDLVRALTVLTRPSP